MKYDVTIHLAGQGKPVMILDLTASDIDDLKQAVRDGAAYSWQEDSIRKFVSGAHIQYVEAIPQN